MRPILLPVAAIALLMCADAFAADAPLAPSAELAGCAALRDAAAYGRKHEDFAYLLPGKDGWFFRTKQDLRSEFKIADSVFKPYKSFVTALRRHDVELVLAYTPPRGMVMREFVPVGDALAPDYRPDIAANNYKRFVAAMNEAGIATVGDTDFKTATPYFYKADHHWASAGANAMADLLAARIKTLPLYAGLPKQEFVTKNAKNVTFPGTFNKVLKALCGAAAANETDQLTQTIQKNNAADTEALFGSDRLPAVTLVGTSNSKKESNNVNFDGLLKEKLSVDILNKAISGGGMDEPLLAYLASDAFRRQPPKLIIWEVPGYYDLKSTKARALMSQAAATVEGDCGDKNLAAAQAAVTSGEDQVVFDDIADKAIIGTGAYLSLKFDQPTRKDVRAAFTYADGAVEEFKFKRTKLYPHDGVYFYAPRADKPLQRVTIKTEEKLPSLHVAARLCALPGKMPAAAKPPDQSSWWDDLLKKWRR